MFHKIHVRTRYAELVILHPEGSAGHIVHFGVSEVRNIDAVFFLIGWDQYGVDKSALGDVMLNLCFLHLVGSAGYVVHSSASGARNIDTLFFHT
jgi:hypothetical protein